MHKNFIYMKESVQLILFMILTFGYVNAEELPVEVEQGFDLTDELDLEDNGSVFSNVKGINYSEKTIEENSRKKEGLYDAGYAMILNKITANSEKRKLSIGEVTYFNNAAITLEKCHQSIENGVNITKMLIQLVEDKVDEDPKLIFRGWLISDQPALHTIEHPIYDIFPLTCTGEKVGV